ncbi:MAG: hypothetical protein H5U30_00505, partial [Marinobacter sp.]|nr:hypothetical protein [Marinobacter sp.]
NVARHRCAETRAQLYRSLLGILLIAFGLSAPSQAATNFELFARHWQPYDWPERTPSASEVTRSQRGIGWHTDIARHTVGIQYDYQPLLIRTGDPAHNGHLHRVTLGGHLQPGLYHIQLSAGLAGTSNMFKYQDFHEKIANGRIAVFRAIREDSTLSLGVGGDHRFGSFRWIPRVRWEHTNEQGRWLLDLPVLAQWQSPDNRWSLHLSRTGDRWATLDKARDVESALYLREWRAELNYRMNKGERAWPEVVLGLGASVDTRVRYQDLDTGTRDLRLGDTLLGSVTFHW